MFIVFMFIHAPDEEMRSCQTVLPLAARGAYVALINRHFSLQSLSSEQAQVVCSGFSIRLNSDGYTQAGNTLQLSAT